MSQDVLESYLDEVQSLSLAEDTAKLVEFVTDLKDKQHKDEALKHFFIAEHAFYSKQYKTALNHYIHARDIPLYNFFCYRASAAVSQMMHSPHKAIEFAKKALDINPIDYPTLKMLYDLYITMNQHQNAAIISQKIDSLKERKRNSGERNLSHPAPISEKEFQEFNSISSKYKPEEQELFFFEAHPDDADTRR